MPFATVSVETHVNFMCQLYMLFTVWIFNVLSQTTTTTSIKYGISTNSLEWEDYTLAAQVVSYFDYVEIPWMANMFDYEGIELKFYRIIILPYYTLPWNNIVNSRLKHMSTFGNRIGWKFSWKFRCIRMLIDWNGSLKRCDNVCVANTGCERCNHVHRSAANIRAQTC